MLVFRQFVHDNAFYNKSQWTMIFFRLKKMNKNKKTKTVSFMNDLLTTNKGVRTLRRYTANQ